MLNQPYINNTTESVWKNKFNCIKNYYDDKYNPKYYIFDKYQMEIDPDEPLSSLEDYSMVRQQQETVKCIQSFPYFCQKYVKILHPQQGLIPFILYKYQHKVISDYESNRFNLISKFRQGGLTTVTLLWGLWRCMFKLDQQIMLLSKTDREATDIGMMIDRSIENMPLWLKPKKDAKWNDHLKMFTETGSSIKFYSPEAARGKSVTFLIIDEAAFIPDMESHWKAMWPVLSTGGGCTLISTVNGIGNWYHQTYVDAKESRNKFHVIELDYWDHPDYNNPLWVAEQKSQLGEKGFLQEVLREFLGTGETYFPSNCIRQLTENTRNNAPSKKLFSKWTNTVGHAFHVESEHNKGALWIWKEPQEGKEYIIGVDCAEGQGENNDNSSFQIVEATSCEQVAEFYSNTVPPHVFAQILNEIGKFYNNALLVVEANGPGSAVLSNLQSQLYYDNIYFQNSNTKNPKAGIRMSQSNRPLFLESLQNKIINDSMRINSIRITNELQTFEYNSTTKKAQAQKGKHDDAIISLCLAVFVRDQLNQDIVASSVGLAPKNSVNKTIYDEIRKELLGDIEEEKISEDELSVLGITINEMNSLNIEYMRKDDKLLRSFGW